MTRTKHLFFLAVAVAAISLRVEAQVNGLLVPESTDDRVLLLSADGSTVVDPNFLDIASAATAAGVSSTPIEAIDVGSEIWVSDQIADRVWRFGQDGAFLGSILEDQVDNIRGMELVDDTLYIAQGNASSQAEGVLMFDVPSMTLTGSFARTDPADISYFDVLAYNGELLVTNIDSGNDAIERFDLAGNFLGFFAQSDGAASFDFMQQLSTRANGNVLGSSFSVPSGVYEFLPDGTDQGIVAALDFGPRGNIELPSGDILWTNGSALQIDTTIVADNGSFRFISPTVVPEPTGFAICLVGLLGLLKIGRQRVA